MKNYLFVTTVPSIYFVVFPLLKKTKGEIVIVAATKQIEMFFKKFTNYKVITLTVDKNCFSSNMKSTVKNVFNVRREYKRLFSNIHDDVIYLFGYSWSLSVFFHIKKLSRRNKVYIYHLGEDISMTKVKGLKPFLLKHTIKLLLNVDVDVVQQGSAVLPTLSDKFFSGFNIIKKSITKIDKKRLKIDMLSGKDILYILESTLNFKQISKKNYIKASNKICKILDKTFRDKYVLKQHYNTEDVYENVSKKALVYPYIPVEFILEYPFKVVIGVASFALITSANVFNKKTISLINLFEYEDIEIKKFYKNWLLQRSDKILYPETFEEFEEMLT